MATTTYLNITIDYGRDELLTPFAKATMKERYMYDGLLSGCGYGLDGSTVSERSPQEAFARASLFCATRNGVTNYPLAQRLYDGCSQLHFGYSTPILSNGGTTRGLPISCFLQYVPDSMDGIAEHWKESAALASKGGGLGAYHGAIRTTGTSTSKGSRSNGMLPFLKVSDSQMAAVSQGTTRRGAYASYLPCSHPEVKYFLNMRKNDGGDIDRKCLNLHHGIIFSDEFMEIIEKARVNPSYDDSWDLVDPHSGEVIETISAVDLWEITLNLRAGSGKGEPYIMFGDTVNRGMPEEQRKQGLEVVQSNLCTEITLPTNEERTAVCCLSSLNLATFDEWCDSDLVYDLTTGLDNVLDHFINHAAPSINTNMPVHYTFNEFSKYVLKSEKAYAKAAYSAYMERSIGIGVMGLHTALQQQGIPWESALATSKNHIFFAKIQASVELATAALGSIRGSAPDFGDAEGHRRNMCTIAVAPTATNSIICGGVSPGIEPVVANVYTHKTDTGNFTVVNPELIKAAGGDVEEVVAYVKKNEGSVQGCDLLSPELQEVFKTAYEIDQQWLVDQASARQVYIDQGQSLNLFFDSKMFSSIESYTKYFESVHFQAWKKGLKTLYYCRTMALKRASASGNTERRRTQAEFIVNEEECLSCQ